MTPETPGQRIARELEEALNAGKGYDLIDAIDAAIEARTELMEAEARHAALVIVRRERDGAVKPLADAVQAFRNLPQLGRLVKLRATPEYVALVDAWDRVAGRYCACGPDVPAHDGVCQGCERVIRGCD